MLEDVLQLFDDMLSEGVVYPNDFALSVAIGACGSIAVGRGEDGGIVGVRS